MLNISVFTIFSLKEHIFKMKIPINGDITCDESSILDQFGQPISILSQFKSVFSKTDLKYDSGGAVLSFRDRFGHSFLPWTPSREDRETERLPMVVKEAPATLFQLLL